VTCPVFTTWAGSEIRGVNIKPTCAYIDQLIGERMLRRSEAYFRVSPENRHFVENYASGAYADLAEIEGPFTAG
jgi:hypothetical protein